MQSDNHVSPIGINYGASLPKQVSTFFTPLLNNTNVDSNVDFITIHNYFANSSWSNLVNDTLSPTIGAASTYRAIAQVVRNRAAEMRHGATTPIFMDEYNGSATGTAEGRNDPTYAPGWNSLLVANMLNSVFNDTHSTFGASQQLPAGLAYWTLSIPGSTPNCMLGVMDSARDCSTKGTMVPYPQYYAYQLYHDPNYLDMGNSAYTVGSNSATDVYTAAFYTKTKDNLVLINTSSTNTQTVNITLSNTGGVSATQANVYTLNATNPHIATQQVSVTNAGNGTYTLTVTAAPVTTIAVSLAASGSGNGGGGGGSAPKVTISASPNTVASGSASNLSWSTQYATNCTASGSWSGSKPLSGTSSTGNLNSSTTYTLICTGVNGSTVASTSVTVKGTPPPPPSETKVTTVKDTFQRPNQQGWGTATDGVNKWTSDTATPGLTIDSNSGHMMAVGTSYNLLAGPTGVTDVISTLYGQMKPLISPNRFGRLQHYQDSNNWYYAYLDGNQLYIQRRLKGTFSVLKSVPFEVSARPSVAIRFKIVGSTLEARSWLTSQNEPTTGSVQVNDSSFSHCQSGIRMNVTNGGTGTITFFQASKLINASLN